MGGTRTFEYLADEVVGYKMDISPLMGGQAPFQKTCYEMFFEQISYVDENCYESWLTERNRECFEDMTIRYDSELYDEDEIRMTYYFEALERYGNSNFITMSILGTHHNYFGIPILNCLCAPAGKCKAGGHMEYNNFINNIKSEFVGQDNPNDRPIIQNGIDTRMWVPWSGFVIDRATWGWSQFIGVLPNINCYDGGCGGSRNGGHLFIDARVFPCHKSLGVALWDIKTLKQFYENQKNNLSFTSLRLNSSAMDEKVKFKADMNWRSGEMSLRETSLVRGVGIYSKDNSIYLNANPSQVNNSQLEIPIAKNIATIRYNNCKNRIDSEKAAWIKIVIPELFPFYDGQVLFSYFTPMSMGSAWDRVTNSSTMNNFYHMGNLSNDSSGVTTIYFQRKAIVKSIVAPYFFYIKQPATTGELTKLYRCAVGETLNIQTPGTYFFPNPCYCMQNQKDMATFGNTADKPIFTAGRENFPYPVAYPEEFFKYFPESLPIYASPEDIDSAVLRVLFENLGVPWQHEEFVAGGGISTQTEIAKSIDMEYLNDGAENFSYEGILNIAL